MDDAEGWQSGNAPDSKSGEPANTGAQVQILYLPLAPSVSVVFDHAIFCVFLSFKLFAGFP